MRGQNGHGGNEQTTSEYVLLSIGLIFVLVMVAAALGQMMHYTLAHISAWAAGLTAPATGPY